MMSTTTCSKVSASLIRDERPSSLTLSDEEVQQTSANAKDSSASGKGVIDIMVSADCRANAELALVCDITTTHIRQSTL